MTTYTITIEDLKPKQLLKLIDSLPFVAMHITKSKVEESKTNSKKRGRMAPSDQVLSLTGKSAQKGSNREAILVTFEKLEVKHSIGNVTRKMLREECAKSGQDSQIIYQLVREGYLKTL